MYVVTSNPLLSALTATCHMSETGFETQWLLVCRRLLQAIGQTITKDDRDEDSQEGMFDFPHHAAGQAGLGSCVAIDESIRSVLRPYSVHGPNCMYVRTPDLMPH